MINTNEKYCNDCGAVINTKAEICPKCGVRQLDAPYGDQQRPFESNRWLITLLLCFFGGALGLHSFYNRKTTIGIIQLLTLGGCGIWALIDLIMIITNNFRDNEGNIISNQAY